MRVRKSDVLKWMDTQSLIFLGQDDEGNLHFDLIINFGKRLAVTHVVSRYRDGNIVSIGGEEDFISLGDNSVVDLDTEIITKKEFWRVYCEEAE